MIQENELIGLILGVGVLIFILANRSRLAGLPAARILLASYYVLLAGWALTVLEGFLWGQALNLLEHFCYALSALLLAVWTWRERDWKEAEP
jgi:hypothetical protein